MATWQLSSPNRLRLYSFVPVSFPSSGSEDLRTISKTRQSLCQPPWHVVRQSKPLGTEMLRSRSNNRICNSSHRGLNTCTKVSHKFKNGERRVYHFSSWFITEIWDVHGMLDLRVMSHDVHITVAIERGLFGACWFLSESWEQLNAGSAVLPRAILGD